jgi:hypothetical protein
MHQRDHHPGGRLVQPPAILSTAQREELPLYPGMQGGFAHSYIRYGGLSREQRGLRTLPKREWNGRHGEIWSYRYANHLPLRGDQEAMEVNWCELIITREGTGEQLYKNAFITDFEVKETTVEAIVRDGRARWKVENENNNVLKTKGYHLEHNFGHGSQHLASLLLTLNLLAFLFHTVLDLVDEKYRLIRQTLGSHRTFFQDFETLLRYFLFADGKIS